MSTWKKTLPMLSLAPMYPYQPIPGKMKWVSTPVSSESVSMNNGVERPATSGPNVRRASISVTFNPTKPDKGIPESDLVLAVTLLMPKDRLATHRLATTNKEKSKTSAFKALFTTFRQIISFFYARCCSCRVSATEWALLIHSQSVEWNRCLNSSYNIYANQEYSLMMNQER